MRAVFSDVDETIIQGKSLFAFAEELAAVAPDGAEVREAFARLVAMMRAGAPRAEVNRAYYQRLLAGRASADVAAIARRWFHKYSADPSFYRADVCAYLDRARAEGARIVLVSGSFPELLAPISERIQAADLLAAPVEQVNGWYTGRLLGEPVIGEGKANAVRRYAVERGLPLERCAGIGDDLSDVPFLSLLGVPMVPTSAAPPMLEHARQAGWALV